MTTVTLFSAPSARQLLQQCSFPAHANMRDSIQQLAFSCNIPPPWQFSVANDLGDTINLTDTRCVGSQPLAVEVQSSLEARVAQQQARLAETEKELGDLRKLQATSATIHVRVMAGQIVSTALGSPLEETQSHRAYNIDAQPAVTILAGLACLDHAVFAQQINKLLDRRNNKAAHQSSVDMLDDQVAMCQGLLAGLPELRAPLKWEAWFIDNYALIKSRLPDQFC